MKLVAFLVSFILVSESSATGQLSALRQYVFQGYDKLVKSDEAMTVRFGLSLINLHLCTEQQTLTTNAWLKIFWKDSRLTWNPAEWNGVSQLNIDASQLWIPDIVIYNGQQVKQNFNVFTDDSPKAVIMSNGEVIFVPPVTLKSFCNSNAKSTTNECKLKFGSWTYHKGLVDVVPLKDDVMKQEPIDYNEFINPNVEVLSATYSRSENKYDCCPDLYPSLTFDITFSQKSQLKKTEL